jgi:hypothetical protein
MIIGMPSPVSNQGSNVTDPAVTLEELLGNCQAPIFEKGLEVQAGEWVYEYVGDSYTPLTWTAEDEAYSLDGGKYEVGQILFKGCKLIKVTGKDGEGLTLHRRPKEPEQYSGWDETIDHTKWTHRYLRVSNSIQCGHLEKLFVHGDRYYTLVYCNQVYKWTIFDRYGGGCDMLQNDLKYSNKFNAGTDVKARIIQWGGSGKPLKPSIQMKSIVERRDYSYFRTHIDAKLEYEEWVTGDVYSYTYMEVISPADIDGFLPKRKINSLNPFDGVNNTKTVFDTSNTQGVASWTMLTTQPIDSIAFGRIICDTVDITILDEDNNILFSIDNYPIDNTVVKGRPEQYPATRVIYTAETIPANSIVMVSLKGAVIELGELQTTSALDAGFTNPQFKHGFKNFNMSEINKWGTWEEVDGIKLRTHTGTVDFKTLDYDDYNNLLGLVIGTRVVMNGSDTFNNELPDGKKIFGSTMMIGRFQALDQQSYNKKKRIGEIATYNFTFQEIG